MKFRFILLFSIFEVLVYSDRIKAQSNVLNIIPSGGRDANKLIEAYLAPMGSGFALATGQNWFNTANSLKLLRFNVQVGASVVLINSNDKYFDPSTLNLQFLKPLGNNVNSVPTISAPFGAESPRWIRYDSLIYPNNQIRYVAVDTISSILTGLNLTNAYAPYAQVNLGLIKNTELNIRIAPTLDLATLNGGIIPDNFLKGKLSYWGLGLKHEVLQWIPVAKLLPISLSLYGNYSRINYALDVNVEGPNSNNFPKQLPFNIAVDSFRVLGSTDFSNQKLSINAESYSYGLVVSKKILMFTPYASIGVQSSKFGINAEGNYPIRSGYEVIPNRASYTEVWQSQSNPISIETKADNVLRTGLGLRVKFVLVSLHAEAFSLGDMRGFSGGLSLGF